MPHLDPTGQSLVDTVRRAPAILFDFFHTLSAVEITHDVLPPETHETLRLDADAWRREWRSLALDRALGRISDPYASIAVPARAANPAIADDLIREAVGIRLAKFEKAVREVPLDVVETLATLRAAGKRLALVSNAEAMEIVRWPGSPLDGAFDATLFSCQVGLAKPDERILYAGLRSTQRSG